MVCEATPGLDTVTTPLKTPGARPAGLTAMEIEEGATPEEGDTSNQPALEEAVQERVPPPAFETPTASEVGNVPPIVNEKLS
jgi:hypothetical protein